MSLYVHIPEFKEIGSSNLICIHVDNLVVVVDSIHTFFTLSGNNTSKNRILYAQMIRCFSV